MSLLFAGDGGDAVGDGEPIVSSNAEDSARYGQLYLYKVSTIHLYSIRLLLFLCGGVRYDAVTRYLEDGC